MNKKICLAGHSGSGKTTLARFISEGQDSDKPIPYFENSAGIIMRPDLLEELKRDFPEWQQNGHKEVINLSNKYPEFGFRFQNNLLISRGKFLLETPSFITDRSPIDNVAYFMLQCSHNQTEAVIHSFIMNAQSLYMDLSHFIYIKSSNPGYIENNGSRVSNLYYQRMVDSVFQDCFDRYFKDLSGPKVLIIDMWDWQERTKRVIEFLR